MNLVVLALGANLGDALGHLGAAAHTLAGRLERPRVASPYRSPPMPTSGPPQPDYVNTVVVGFSCRPAREWLALAQALEISSGRRPAPRWGARHLDIDLIAIGQLELKWPELCLPHPGLADRRFVLAPLAELVPDLEPPGLASVSELLKQLGPQHPAVTRLEWPPAISGRFPR